MELYGVEESDRLYYNTLFITLVLYILASGAFLGLKRDVNPMLDRPQISKRLTRLIVNLPAPPEPEKDIVLVKAPPPPPKKEKKKVEKASPKKKAPKPKKKSLPKKDSVKNLEKTGMLQFMDGLDEEAEDLGLPDDFEILSVSDGLNMDAGDSVVFASGEILPDDEVEFSQEEYLLSNLSEKYDFSREIIIEMPEMESLDDSEIPLEIAQEDMEVRDASFIGKTVSKYSDGLKYCYDKSLKQRASLRGGITVQFTILSLGTTEEVSIVSGDLKDKGLQNCLTGLIARWTFPTSKIEHLVVTYPIHFINRT